MTAVLKILPTQHGPHLTPKTSGYWVSPPEIMYCDSDKTPCSQHGHYHMRPSHIKCAIPECHTAADSDGGSDDEGSPCQPGCKNCKKIVCWYHMGNEDNTWCRECNGGK